MPMIQETPEIQREFDRAWEQVRPPAGIELQAAPAIRIKLSRSYFDAWDSAFPGIPCAVVAECGWLSGGWKVSVEPANEDARNRLLELLDARIEARKQARREEALEEVCAYV